MKPVSAWVLVQRMRLGARCSGEAVCATRPRATIQEANCRLPDPV